MVELDGEIHRLVDGGAYANYPSFVFDDASFRAFHHLPKCDDLPTIGFVLDQGETVEHSTGQPLSAEVVPLATDRGSVERELGILGAAIGSPLMRWSLVLLPVLFALTTALWLIAEAEHSFPVIGALPGTLNVLGDVGLLLLLLTLGTIGVIGAIAAVVLVRLGRELLDGGIMGAVAAMGVGPNVPYWVGAADTEQGRHIAVRLAVPGELTTLSFGAPNELVERAICEARENTAQQLQIAFGGRPAATPPNKSLWPAPIPGSELASDAMLPEDVSLHRLTDLRLRMKARLLPRQRSLASVLSTILIGFASYLVAGFAGFAAFQGLARLIDGRVALGVTWLVGSGLAMLLVLIGFAARANTPWRALHSHSSAV